MQLTIKGVEAKAVLKVRLDNVARILDRVLTTIDNNPEIIGQLVARVGQAAGEVAAGAGEVVDVVTGAPARGQPAHREAGEVARRAVQARTRQMRPTALGEGPEASPSRAASRRAARRSAHAARDRGDEEADAARREPTADVEIVASAAADELRFHSEPEVRVGFPGTGERESRQVTTRRTSTRRCSRESRTTRSS